VKIRGVSACLLPLPASLAFSRWIRVGTYCVLVVGLWCVNSAGASEPSFTVITNQTPSVAVPEAWAYESAPGSYFWNGFRSGAAIVAFCFIFSAIRTAICHDKEEL